MPTPQSLLSNPKAEAFAFNNTIVGVITFDNNTVIPLIDDQYSLERYVMPNADVSTITQILNTRTTTKYMNLGGLLGPINPDDGIFSVTTGTYMWDYNHMSDLPTGIIPSIWSVKSMINDGLSEILDPEIDVNQTYMYRLTWVRNEVGYSTNYFLLSVGDLQELGTQSFANPCDIVEDDGGTVLQGVDGNPTILDLGYCNGQGNANLVDDLLREDSWVDRCTSEFPSLTIEFNRDFSSYGIDNEEFSFICPPHILNRYNFRYKGAGEEEKMTSYEQQIRNVLFVIQNRMIADQNIINIVMFQIEEIFVG